jgi:metallophosphoesterase superfamily enzyme
VATGGLGSSGAGNVEAARGATQGNADQAQMQSQRVAQVVIQGNVFSARETADWLIGQLSEAINDRDVVFINGNSRQAGLIGGGA